MTDTWGFASRDDPAFARYLQLPPLPERIRALAREVTPGIRTPYEAALRLNAYLARGFAYTLALERRTALPPLEEFLFVRRSGNCEYFAASLAVSWVSVDDHQEARLFERGPKAGPHIACWASGTNLQASRLVPKPRAPEGRNGTAGWP